MARYSAKDISLMYGASRTTCWRHIKSLVKSKKFKKTGVGRYYNENDIERLSDLLGFKLDTSKLKHSKA